MQETSDYDLTPSSNPVVHGTALQAVALLTRMPVTGSLLLGHLKKLNDFGRVSELAAILPDVPVFFPFVAPSQDQQAPSKQQLSLQEFNSHKPANAQDSNVFKYYSIADYTSRYLSGELTPLQVAKAVVQIIEREDHDKLRAFLACNKDQVLQAAEEATKRYQQGKPLGVLDGVPVAIKDEVDVRGYKTALGTTFLGDKMGVKGEDEIAVQRLRDAGAVIVGKTNMVELGGGITGYNMHYGTPCNPHNAKHYPGGSSSGSAASVGAGIVPLALGVDSGGSIRIPAALCGVVGFKASFGRTAKLSDGCPTLGHIGPITANVRDAAIGYAIMSGGHNSYPPSLSQPAIDLSSFEDTQSLAGVRIGVFDEYLNDANAEVVDAVKKAIDTMVEKGATVVKVHLNHLHGIRMAHAATILCELSRSMYQHSECFSCICPEVQINLKIAEMISGSEFIACQKVRGFAMRQIDQVFKQADVFVTPSTAITAPRIPHKALRKGESNLQLVLDVMRFAFLGNFVGIPGIAVPIGYDSEGLPISIQLQTSHWREDLCLRVAHAVEEAHAAVQKKPEIFFDVLDEAKKQTSKRE